MSLYMCPSHRITTARVPPKVNCGLQAAVTCQRRFIVDKPRTVLMSEADCGGGSPCVCGGGGQVVYRKSLYLSLNFIVNLNCSLKIIFKKKL